MNKAFSISKKILSPFKEKKLHLTKKKKNINIKLVKEENLYKKIQNQKIMLKSSNHLNLLTT